MNGGGHLGGKPEALGLGAVDLLGAEKMGGGDSPEGSPVGAVGSKADGAMEHEAVCRVLNRAVGEGGTVEDLLGDVGMARDYNPRLSEAEGHEAGCGEEAGGVRQLVVGEAGHQVNAAQEGDASGPRDCGTRSSQPKVFSPCGPTWGGPVEEGSGEAGQEKKECKAQEVLRRRYRAIFCSKGQNPEAISCGFHGGVEREKQK